MATRRVQIREAGILTKQRLIRWRELLGFSLELDGVLRFRMQAPEGKVIGCAIPAADREVVDHLLASRLPALSTPSARSGVDRGSSPNGMQGTPSSV